MDGFVCLVSEKVAGVKKPGYLSYVCVLQTEHHAN